MIIRLITILLIFYIIFGIITVLLSNSILKYQKKRTTLFSSILTFSLWPIFISSSISSYKAMIITQISDVVLNTIITQFYTDKYEEIAKSLSSMQNGMSANMTNMFMHFANTMNNNNGMNIPPNFVDNMNVQDTVENPEVINTISHQMDEELTTLVEPISQNGIRVDYSSNTPIYENNVENLRNFLENTKGDINDGDKQ